jgi:glycerol-3-phosphate acyltransferase PlsY
VEFVAFAVVILSGYLLGSIPTGYVVGKIRGIDIRKVGSGNIGATNTFRVLGRKAGIFVLVVDAMKGFIAARFLGPLLIAVRPELGSAVSLDNISLAAGTASVLGHNYTCWLNFKGGKGIATSGAVIIALVPTAAGIVVAVWGIVFAISRYVSLASITAAIALPVTVWIMGATLPVKIVMTVLGVIAIFKHRKNIERLMAGTENRVGSRKEGVG